MKGIIKAVLKKMFWSIYFRDRVILDKLDYIINKLSLPDDIVKLKDALFWVPNAPRDFIQNTQLSKLSFFELGILQKLDNYLTKDSVVVDIGATFIIETDVGNLKLDKFDNFIEIIDESVIDLVKIDVEGFEKNVLLGAVNFFARHKPVVFIESYKGINQYDFVYDYFKKLNYNEPIKYGGDDYLFIRQE